MQALIARRLAMRRLDTPLVFHVAGRPMGDWRKRWARACLRAGSQDPTTKKITIRKLRYDFRRTAVRNLTRSGVTERIAMEQTGHNPAQSTGRREVVGPSRPLTPRHCSASMVRPAGIEPATYGFEVRTKPNPEEA